MSNAQGLNQAAPRVVPQGAGAAQGMAERPAAPARGQAANAAQGTDVLESNVAQGRAPATTQNPNILIRGIKKFWGAVGEPLFDGKNKMTDALWGEKTVINKIWKYTPGWVAALPVGVGIGLAIAYKATLIGALGAFFSSHVGWAVGAAVGALVLAAIAVRVYMYFSKKNDVAADAVDAKHNEKILGFETTVKTLTDRIAQLESAAVRQGGVVEGLGAAVQTVATAKQGRPEGQANQARRASQDRPEGGPSVRRQLNVDEFGPAEDASTADGSVGEEEALGSWAH